MPESAAGQGKTADVPNGSASKGLHGAFFQKPVAPAPVQAVPIAASQNIPISNVNVNVAMPQVYFPAYQPQQYAPSPMSMPMQTPPAGAYGYYPPQPAGMQMPTTQYVEYSPGVFYPVSMVPTQPFYPQHVISIMPPKNDEVITKLLNDIDKSVSDQSSCRLLQKRLEEEQSRHETKMARRLFDKVINNVVTHMNSVFGNYLCQKLFEQLTEEQLYLVIKRVCEDVVDVCNNIHGTRSIQQLIRISSKSPELRQEIAKMLSGHIFDIITVQIKLEIG